MNIIYSASHAFDVTDPNTGEAHSIHRCDSCCALIDGADVNQHFEWHGSLLHHHVPPGVVTE